MRSEDTIAQKSTSCNQQHIRPENDSPTTKRMRVSNLINIDTQNTQEIIIAQGAEGIVSKIWYVGRIAIKKERFAKKYRHPELDSKLTARRLAQEARILLRMRKAGIRVPAIYHVDLKRNILIQEFCKGQTLKQFLYCVKDEQIKVNVMIQAGKQIAQMHKTDIVHGDLTTSNIMVLIDPEKQIDELDQNMLCLIDFGLSSSSGTEEDIAVDLYVFERAVISAHSESAEPLNKAFLNAYEAEIQRPQVIKRLNEVRARGRKRDMTG